MNETPTEKYARMFVGNGVHYNNTANTSVEVLFVFDGTKGDMVQMTLA
jgi:hypothetical protein